jgi:hypothetical protein
MKIRKINKDDLNTPGVIDAIKRKLENNLISIYKYKPLKDFYTAGDDEEKYAIILHTEDIDYDNLNSKIPQIKNLVHLITLTNSDFENVFDEIERRKTNEYNRLDIYNEAEEFLFN